MQGSLNYSWRWLIACVAGFVGALAVGCVYAPPPYQPYRAGAGYLDERYTAPRAAGMQNTWGVWDDGDYFSTDDVLDLNARYGLCVYYFSEVVDKRRKLDLDALSQRGITAIRIFPRRMIAKDADLIRDPRALRQWAEEALADPAVGGVAVDFEYGYALKDHGATPQDLARLLETLSIEAHARQKLLMVTTFPTPHRVQDVNHVSAEAVKRFADVMLPFEYSHGKRQSYREAVVEMVDEWRKVPPRDKPVFALIDWGRGPAVEGYSHPQEAVKVPGQLRADGVRGVVVFYAHVPYSLIKGPQSGIHYRFADAVSQHRATFRQFFMALKENYATRGAGQMRPEHERRAE